MAHDPISFLFRGSSPSTDSFLVPRITGEVHGAEIPVKKGYYAYLGKIEFRENSVLVNLFIDNTDDKKIYPALWNGTYILKKEP
jgi:hypothetical protein